MILSTPKVCSCCLINLFFVFIIILETPTYTAEDPPTDQEDVMEDDGEDEADEGDEGMFHFRECY